MTKRSSTLFLIVVLISFAFTAYVFDLSQAQTQTPSISGKFYKFDLVARTGDNELNYIGSSISINDSGTVALFGKTVPNSLNAIHPRPRFFLFEVL